MLFAFVSCVKYSTYVQATYLFLFADSEVTEGQNFPVDALVVRVTSTCWVRFSESI